MIAILTLITVLVLSLLIVRVATISLTLTGISREMARFQARSAFTGAGFTTSESEKVVSHPVRRRIIMLLMLLGNAGIVTAVSSLILGFASPSTSDGFTGTVWFRMVLLLTGLVFLWYAAHSQWVDRWMSRVIERALRRWTNLDVCDYASLLHLTGDYMVSEMLVRAESWLAGRTLQDLALNREGVIVLGIERSMMAYMGAPRGPNVLKPGDTLLLYGRGRAIADLDKRPAGAEGNKAHVEAVERQIAIERTEEIEAEMSGAS